MPSQQETPNKARGFVVDEKTGRPLAGVVLAAEAEIDQGSSVLLGMVATDHAGYATFDLTALKRPPVSLHIYTVNEEPKRVNIRISQSNWPLPTRMSFLFRMARAATTCATTVSLPSIQKPDRWDWEISPVSFVTKASGALGDSDCCESLVPSTLPEQEFTFTRIVLRSERIDLVNTLDTITPLDLSQGAKVDVERQNRIRFGEALEFVQQWVPLGHSLGQILYSLALAPCESVNIAVIDWSREDTVSRTDQVVSNEQLYHRQRRDRTLKETISAALDEAQGGWSRVSGVSGAAGGNVGAIVPVKGVPINIGGNASGVAAQGSSMAQTWGDRDITGDSTQELHDTTTQTTAATRSLNSTIVVQGTQQESNVLQTRTVTNHNHCHALTVQYYEVLRHLQVVTRFQRRRQVVMIPFQLLDFTWELALRYQLILKSALLEPKLADCFEAIARLHDCPAIYEEQEKETETKPPTPKEPIVESYVLTIETGNRNTWGTVEVSLKYDGQWLSLYTNPKASSDTDPNAFLKNSSKVFEITTGDCIGRNPNKITGARVRWVEADGQDQWLLRGIKIQCAVKGISGRFELLDIRREPYLYDFNNSSPFSSTTPIDYELSVNNLNIKPPADNSTEQPEEELPPTKSETSIVTISKTDDECCERTLLRHLNGNRGFYSRAVWLLQDPVERSLMLDVALDTRPDIRYGMGEIPLAVRGNLVAFAYEPAEQPKPDNRTIPEEQISIVSLPTRGVFAEAQLGQCNSCEKRDVTRFWQWEESPCAPAPAIQGIEPGPQGQAPNVTPTALPGPVVQIAQPLAAPDPLDLAAALKVLGTPDLFRDMSGLSEVSSLLEKLASGTVSSAQEAQKLAQQAQDKLKEVASKSGSTGSGGKSTPSEVDPSKQVDKLNTIKYALEEGLINEQQAADAATGILGGVEFASTDTSLGGIRIAFLMKDSVGQSGVNNSADVRAVQQRLVSLGFDWLATDGKMGSQTINTIKLFQAIINGHERVSGHASNNGLIEVEDNTYKWMQAINAPRWQIMPVGSWDEGFFNVERMDAKDTHDYGTNWMGDTIATAGATYKQDYLDNRPTPGTTPALLTINDVSLPRGGDTPDHTGHEAGLSCDIRLPRKDGTAPGGTTWNQGANVNPVYDRDAMRAMLTAIKDQPLWKLTYFNDPDLIAEGLCIQAGGHDDHAHFEIKPPERGGVELTGTRGTTIV